MAVAQARLDESTAKIEELEDELEHANHEVAEIEARMDELEKKDAKLEAVVVGQRDRLGGFQPFRNDLDAGVPADLRHDAIEIHRANGSAPHEIERLT